MFNPSLLHEKSMQCVEDPVYWKDKNGNWHCDSYDEYKELKKLENRYIKISKLKDAIYTRR